MYDTYSKQAGGYCICTQFGGHSCITHNCPPEWFFYFFFSFFRRYWWL